VGHRTSPLFAFLAVSSAHSTQPQKWNGCWGFKRISTSDSRHDSLGP